MFDLFGEIADGFFSVRGEVGGGAFGEESEEIDPVAVGNVEIEDASAAAGAFALGGHADLTDAAAADHEVALVGMIGEHALKGGVFVIGNEAGDEFGEVRGFDENHFIKGVTESHGCQTCLQRINRRRGPGRGLEGTKRGRFCSFARRV